MPSVARRLVPVLLVTVVVQSWACANGRFGPSASQSIRPAPRPLDKLAVNERLEILRRAQVWRPVETPSLDLLAGPSAPLPFKPDEAIACTYVFPPKPFAGVTPKFQCALDQGRIVKVKYGKDNGEVYAEVAASRLFWALGFAADYMYPVRVTCRNCPADPFREGRAEWHLGRSGNVAERLFDPAAVEVEYPGLEVEERGFEGWSWNELAQVDESAGGAPRAHLDALRLLAVFLQHVDSKPDQQAIVCTPGSEGVDAEGNATCAAPMLVVRDLGTTFARATRMNYPKMDLDSWRAVRIWKDPVRCVGDLTQSITGTFGDPVISEAGRQFLADGLSKLNDRQIRDLFAAARVERRGAVTRDETGRGRPVQLEDWIGVFKDKRAQIVDHRCPAGT